MPVSTVDRRPASHHASRSTTTVDVAPCEWCGVETSNREGRTFTGSSGTFYVHCCPDCKPRYERFAALCSGIGNPFAGLDGDKVQSGVDETGKPVFVEAPAEYPKLADKPWVAGEVRGAKVATSDRKALAGFAKASGKGLTDKQAWKILRGGKSAPRKSRASSKVAAPVVREDPAEELSAAVRGLKDAEVRLSSAIVDARAAGIGVSAIASKVGVSRQAIYQRLSA